ncbi:hypothetical protein GGR56DRAFT_302479 [Xylariaceae sp. FL0804]|nr:hypothetical protein GGR56DRAFT_302479 [Xylariaceae sp. FL0804]
MPEDEKNARAAAAMVAVSQAAPLTGRWESDRRVSFSWTCKHSRKATARDAGAVQVVCDFIASSGVNTRAAASGSSTTSSSSIRHAFSWPDWIKQQQQQHVEPVRHPLVVGVDQAGRAIQLLRVGSCRRQCAGQASAVHGWDSALISIRVGSIARPFHGGGFQTSTMVVVDAAPVESFSACGESGDSTLGYELIDGALLVPRSAGDIVTARLVAAPSHGERSCAYPSPAGVQETNRAFSSRKAEDAEGASEDRKLNRCTRCCIKRSHVKCTFLSA